MADAVDASAADSSSGAEATLIAKRWFDAIRSANVKTLEEMARFPFQYRDTRTEVGCADGRARQRAELDKIFDCLLHRSLLREALATKFDGLSNGPFVPAPRIEAVEAKQLPKWTRRWRSDLKTGAVTVHVHVAGDGINFHSFLLIADGGVLTMWKDAVFEPD